MSTTATLGTEVHVPETAVEAGTRVRPPVLFFGTLATGLLLQRLFPFTMFSHRRARIVGAALSIAGLAIGASSIRSMTRAGTPVQPHLPTSAVVTDGPYRYTRNPIYLGMTLLYAGISGLANAAWPLLLLPAVLYGITTGMIEHEERYLEQRFGDQYRQYRERVRRWI